MPQLRSRKIVKCRLCTCPTRCCYSNVCPHMLFFQVQYSLLHINHLLTPDTYSPPPSIPHKSLTFWGPLAGSWPKKLDNCRNFHYRNSPIFSGCLSSIVTEMPHRCRFRYYNRDSYARSRQLNGIFRPALYTYSC